MLDFRFLHLAFCVLGCSLFAALDCLAQTPTEEHTVVIAGVAGKPGTWYKIEVDGSIEKVDGELDSFLVTTEVDDIAIDNLVRGEVQAGDADGFRIEGAINTLLVQDGARALIVVDGVTLDTNGSEAKENADEAPVTTEDEAETSGSSDASSGAFVWKPGLTASERLGSRRLTPKTATSSSPSKAVDAPESSPVLTMTPIKKTADLILIAPSADGKADKGNETSGRPVLRFDQAVSVFSGVSGRRGEQQVSFDFSSQPINSIGWNEKFDKPCGVGVVSRVYGQAEKGRILARCGDDEPFMCEQTVCTGTPALGVSFQRSVQIPGLRAGITSLQACTNNRRNGRIKGLKITGGEISAGGVGRVQSTDSDEMAHCRDWEDTVRCANGSVATGIRAHFDEGGGASPNTDQLVGIELICRAVAAD